MSRRIPHSDYYNDRQSEYELCRDFPADEIFIDGLHAMQTHFMRRGMAIDIPVLRVMNTAHWLVAYMFATSCSGDQAEYDVMTYDSVGHDKQLTIISLIVLAAMLKRTEGMRARSCRSILLEDRSEDFYDGVSLYEQFLENGEAHFTQEDFESDIMRELNQRDELIAQQASQIITLQETIKTMNQQNNQYNNCVVYQAPVYNTNNTTNNYYPQRPSPSVSPTSDVGQSSSPATNENSEIPDSIIFTKKAKKEVKEAAIIEALKNSVQGRRDKTRAFVDELHTWQEEGYVDAHYNAQVMYDELAKLIPLSFGYEVFKKHYNNTRS